jgi:hypothetical protein
MHDLFNPAGLHMLEDREGAVAYGWIAQRVFYGRFVGSLSAELGTSFAQRLAGLLENVPALAYFADASALDQYDLVARTRFQRLVLAQRAKFVSLTFLTWAGGVGPAARHFAALLGEPIDMLTDPFEFDRALSNVAPLPLRVPFQLEPVWQVHAPR